MESAAEPARAKNAETQILPKQSRIFTVTATPPISWRARRCCRHVGHHLSQERAARARYAAPPAPPLRHAAVDRDRDRIDVCLGEYFEREDRRVDLDESRAVEALAERGADAGAVSETPA